MNVGFRRFNWIKTPSAWQNLQNQRHQRAAGIQRHLNMIDGINAALSSAQQNKISGMANNAAQSALTRLQATAKAKSAEMTKQIDDAQKLVDSTKSTAPADTGSAATVLDTIA